MNLNKIGIELEQLSALAASWKTAGRIDGLERELALEKLRRIYEALRFAEPAEEVAVSEDELPVEIPVNLDLDGMLGIITPAGNEPAEFVSVSVPEAEPAGARFVAEASPVVADVPAPEADATAPPLPEAVQPEQAAESEPERSGAVEPEPTPEPAAPQPVTERPKVIEPDLFGMDEVVQHKRKQRVIMSLYDERPSAPVPAPVPAGSPEPSSRTESVKEEFAAVAESLRNTGPLPAPVPEQGQETVPVEAASATGKPAQDAGIDSVSEISVPGTVLGDVINRGVQTLGDKIAPPRDAVSDMAHKTPVNDLREAIGINDKFLLIRDLFDGDAAACDAAIDALNGFTDLDDCMIHIAEHYAWNPNSDGARLLVELLERKLA